jgi:hypothetical protein
MSERTLRRWLWLAALLAAPLPIFGLASGSVPPLHQLQLGALALAFSIAERAQGVGPLLALLFLGQAFVYAVALWLAAALAARGLSYLPPLLRTRVAFFGVVLGLALALVQPIYHTPYSSRAAHSSLLDVYR